MTRKLAVASLVLFGISVILLALLTLFESVLVGISPDAERLITFLFLVWPAGLGAILGVMSLVHQEGRIWLAIAGIILNTFFAIFHLMIVLFAG